MSILSKGNSGRLELILVYTGDGKGKTSACIGQAMRAFGQGLSVTFAQFIKRPDIAGEQKILSRLLGESFRAGGLGFVKPETERECHARAARELLDWLAMHPAQLTVLDEAIYALNYGILDKDSLMPFIDKSHGSGFHLVLSGRGAPGWLCGMAHIVTEMRSVKHMYENGVTAIPGIEF